MSQNFSYFQTLPLCILDLNNDPEGRDIADVDTYIAEKLVEAALPSNFYSNSNGEYVGTNYPVPYTLSELCKFFWRADNVFWQGMSGTCPESSMTPGDGRSNPGATLTRGIPRYVRLHMNSCEDYINRGDLMYAWMVGHPTQTEGGVDLGFGGCGAQHGYYGQGVWDPDFCGFYNEADATYWEFRAFGHPVPSNFTGTEAERNFRFPQCIKSGDLYYPQMTVYSGGIECGSEHKVSLESFAILINGTVQNTCPNNQNVEVTVTCDVTSSALGDYTVDFEVDDGIVKQITLFDVHGYTSCPSPCQSGGTAPLDNVEVETFGFNFYQ